ncbi:MAG: twin-arginine translocase TatA/TatE family subunit [Deltaproteobacteria bacterium]|nr:twin-arginine translocase TatA/TatE family subunit [Deltaproteobacteria bacterium]
MFGIGITELLVVLIAALIIIGPDKLPAIARTLGKAFVEVRRAGEDLKKTITEVDLVDSGGPPAGIRRPSAGKKKPAATGAAPGDGARPVAKPDKKVT